MKAFNLVKFSISKDLNLLLFFNLDKSKKRYICS